MMTFPDFLLIHKRHGSGRSIWSVLEAITKLDRKLNKIMSNINELIAAVNTLSTASDSLSIKVDTLVSSVDKAIAVLQQEPNLSPAGEAALVTLKNSTTAAAAAGDKVDAEVAKLDAVLPTPAPAGS